MWQASVIYVSWNMIIDVYNWELAVGLKWIILYYKYFHFHRLQIENKQHQGFTHEYKYYNTFSLLLKYIFEF